MRTNKKTICLAKVRRLMREAINWYIRDDGMPGFWNKEDYKYARKVSKEKIRIGNYPYYTRSDKAIEEIATKIYKLIKYDI